MCYRPHDNFAKVHSVPIFSTWPTLPCNTSLGNLPTHGNSDVKLQYLLAKIAMVSQFDLSLVQLDAFLEDGWKEELYRP